MKKMKIFKAFSLAEALITLLIVCLITIASVPVITKKKRTHNEAMGKWVCTRNLAGQYVVFDSTNATASEDYKNPETWKKTANDGQTACVFVPKKNTKYSVTVVGGGGGGADGVSKIETIAKVTGETGGIDSSYIPENAHWITNLILKAKESAAGKSITFTPERSDLYDVVLIGGGGGGGGSQSSESDTAGGGGGGAMVKGKVVLYNTSAYTLTAGNGGEPRGGEHHGGTSSSTSHPRAQNGGKSMLDGLTSKDNTFLFAAGGQGGDSIGCSNWKCRGGSLGYGAESVEQKYNSKITINGITKESMVGTTDGASGIDGDYYKCLGSAHVANSGGKNYYTTTSSTETTYGNGGNAGESCTPIGATSGKSGYAIVYKTWQLFGKGGDSAKPNTYFVPDMNGKLVVTIPDAASAGEKGGTTVAKIVKGDKVGQIYQGYGGDGGTAATEGEDISGPTAGAHSQVTMIGGGIAAPECTKSALKHGKRGDTVTITKKRCKKVACQLIDVKNYPQLESLSRPYGGDLVTPMGMVRDGDHLKLKQETFEDSVTEKYYEPESIPTANGALTTNEVKDYYQAIKLYHYAMSKYGSPIGKLKSYLEGTNEGDTEKTEFAEYSNAAEIYNKRCFRDDNLVYEKVCEEEEIYETEKKISSFGIYYQPAVCKENGGAGTSYGAGGGGGNVGDSAGVKSNGGNGGYGAVIVDW